MTILQSLFSVNTNGRDTYEITSSINSLITEKGIPHGLVHIFVQHTSASLLITENADPDVRIDLETLIKRLAPDADPEYRHTLEGPDDMSAHGRSMLTQTELTIPIRNGQLDLGTWQGIYLWEHRVDRFRRNITLTFMT